MIGVAFQNMPDAENIGYIIPNLVVNHFLEDIDRFGKSVGFPGLGLVFQHLPDTKAVHRFFNMDVNETGVVVTRIWPKAPADGFLQAHDIILEIGINSTHKATFSIFFNKFDCSTSRFLFASTATIIFHLQNCEG